MSGFCSKMIQYMAIITRRYMRIRNRTQAFEWCYFQWPWLTFSDLAKYSMTRSIDRGLCDSWVSGYVAVEIWAEFILCFSIERVLASVKVFSVSSIRVSGHVGPYRVSAYLPCRSATSTHIGRHGRVTAYSHAATATTRRRRRKRIGRLK